MIQCTTLTDDKEETTDTWNGYTHLPAAALSLTASILELSRHANRTLVILCRYTDHSQHLRQECTHFWMSALTSQNKEAEHDPHALLYTCVYLVSRQIFVRGLKMFAHEDHSVVVNVFPESLKNMVFAMRMSWCCVDRLANLATCPRCVSWCTHVG